MVHQAGRIHPNVPQRLHWEERPMDKLELRLSLNTGVKGYWPDPPASHSQTPHVNGRQSPQKSFAHSEATAQAVASHQETHLLSWDHSFNLTSFFFFCLLEKCGQWDRGAPYTATHQPCHTRSGCQWHRDKGVGGGGESHGDGAGELTWVEHRGRAVAVVATIWSIEPSVSARRGKCAQAKWTYSTWRAYRSVFTCLLLQVVQTGRLPFFQLWEGHDAHFFFFFLQTGTT